MLAIQEDLGALQYHADQAFVAHQLAESSNARARAIRARLVAKIRRLYETDHHQAAAAAYAVDDATTIAIRGLLTSAPISTEGFEFPIDRLLLHADPEVFDGLHPTLAASRAALAAESPSSPEGEAPASSPREPLPEGAEAYTPVSVVPNQPQNEDPSSEDDEKGGQPASTSDSSPAADPIEESDGEGSDGE